MLSAVWKITYIVHLLFTAFRQILIVTSRKTEMDKNVEKFSFDILKISIILESKNWKEAVASDLEHEKVSHQ